jgi:hypothetical protein
MIQPWVAYINSRIMAPQGLQGVTSGDELTEATELQFFSFAFGRGVKAQIHARDQTNLKSRSRPPISNESQAYNTDS